MNEKYERLGTPLEDYELTRRDRQCQRTLQEIREHARREAAKAPPLPAEALEKVAMLLSQPTPDWQILRWRVRLFCGHIVEACRHYEMKRPTDHGCSSERCPECGMDPAATSRTSPSALPRSQSPRRRRHGLAPDRPGRRRSCKQRTLDFGRSSDACALDSLKPANRPDPGRAGRWSDG